MMEGSFLTVLRKLTLLCILLMVAVGSYLTRARATSWEEPLWIAIYPIDGDKRERTRNYLSGLDRRVFAPVETFMLSEARRYGIGLEQPVRVDLGLPIEEIPPEPPPTANPLRIGLWSLQLRWWAHTVTRDQPGPPPDIRLFVVYHDPEINPVLAHSLGLQKGMLGVVNVFATREAAGSNNFIITHEMLHTLGATDKYAGGSVLPIYPAGYADPDQRPLYPQTHAEIMGGRIPVSEAHAEMPSGLQEARVGRLTAAEIRWTE